MSSGPSVRVPSLLMGMKGGRKKSRGLSSGVESRNNNISSSKGEDKVLESTTSKLLDPHSYSQSSKYRISPIQTTYSDDRSERRTMTEDDKQRSQQADPMIHQSQQSGAQNDEISRKSSALLPSLSDLFALLPPCLSASTSLSLSFSFSAPSDQSDYTLFQLLTILVLKIEQEGMEFIDDYIFQHEQIPTKRLMNLDLFFHSICCCLSSPSLCGFGVLLLYSLLKSMSDISSLFGSAEQCTKYCQHLMLSCSLLCSVCFSSPIIDTTHSTLSSLAPFFSANSFKSDASSSKIMTPPLLPPSLSLVNASFFSFAILSLSVLLKNVGTLNNLIGYVAQHIGVISPLLDKVAE
ncbi:hypothetical protein ADUPG1_000723, partial [Aduncisulcus paluster]